MEYIIRAGSLQDFPELIMACGGDPFALLEAEGIEPAVLKTPDSYIPYKAVARLLTRAALTCQHDDFGALLAQRQGLHVVGALATQLCLQPTLSRALQLIQRHVDFHARGVAIDIQLIGNQLQLTMDFAFAHQVECDQLALLSLGLLARSVEQLCGHILRPTRVELPLPMPADMRQLQSLFGSSISFGAPYSRLFYKAELLNLPIQAPPALRERLSAQWRGGDASQPPLSLPLQVQRAIVALLPTGDCSLQSVARMVELHPRVLQLHLKAEAGNFGQILRGVRQKLACEHLARSDIRLTDLAMHLGYAELAVFSRSFKQWTGETPTGWRQRHGQKIEGSSLQ